MTKEVFLIDDYWGDFLSNSIFPKYDNFPIVFSISSCFDWG